MEYRLLGSEMSNLRACASAFGYLNGVPKIVHPPAGVTNTFENRWPLLVFTSFYEKEGFDGRFHAENLGDLENV